MARIAPAAQAILSQATYFRPKRSKASDGTLGDRAHRRRKSDHNPDGRGIVHAADLTHDPAHGMDAHGWALWLAAKNDPRVKLIISNRRFWEPGRGWRRYTGENPHTKHVHVSVKASRENDTSPWFSGWFYRPAVVLPAPPPPAPVPVANPNVGPGAATALQRLAFIIGLSKQMVLVKGDGHHNGRNDAVSVLQLGLTNAHIWWLGKQVVVLADGEFGQHTEGAVKLFQASRGLVADGKVGPATWKHLYP